MWARFRLARPAGWWSGLGAGRWLVRPVPARATGPLVGRWWSRPGLGVWAGVRCLATG